jgi:sRNA-binding regulator protein Hfq
MPMPLALAVAYGKLSLNDALERLAQKEKVQRVMDRYDLTRALATQVVLGHADLEQVLQRRRFAEHREANLQRTCLVPGSGLTLVCHGGRAVVGTIEAVEPYLVLVHERGAAAPEPLHKLQIQYAYPTDAWKKVKKAVRSARGAVASTPVIRPQDRYTCSDRRLFGLLDEGATVEVRVLGGDTLTGQVTWFGRYEFGLQVKGEVEVTLFRHALQHIGAS